MLVKKKKKKETRVKEVKRREKDTEDGVTANDRYRKGSHRRQKYELNSDWEIQCFLIDQS